MKNLPFFCSVLLLLSIIQVQAQPTAKAKTKAAKTTASNPESLGMRGAYQMTRQHASDGTRDTSFNRQQQKIYTDKHMIYVHAADNDSLAVYGIGTYKVENGKVIENVFFTSDSGAVNERYELAINKLGDGYSQVIYFNDQASNNTFVLTEDYKRVDKNITSPLDGAWKQVKRISIAKDGTTITDENPTQFKVYQAGNFIWVNTSRDTVNNKPVSYYGYGTFKMKGQNELVENNTNTTFASVLVGTPVTVQIKFTGKDSYQQTIMWPNGNKEIEVYQRLQ